MLHSDEMQRAAFDDFGPNPPFAYAVAGHDIDVGGIDGAGASACCQCYQLVFDLPESEARVLGDGGAAVPIPKPLVVEVFSTSVSPETFDLFMAAGGLGAFNACDPNGGIKSPSGLYLYSKFPAAGEPAHFGVNAAAEIPECRDRVGWVTEATLSSASCVSSVKTTCGDFASSTLSSEAVNASIRSCIASNDPQNDYHMSWSVYARRVECPVHLTEVTGCKLAPQGLPAADPSVTTAEQARQNAGFKPGYSTMPMQDCCKPTCAWADYVTGSRGGLTAVGSYNSVYTCDQSGIPLTE